MSEEYTQLVEGCKNRERRAMKRLYDLTAPMAMGVCMRYSHDRDAAQDLMQEGYIKVYEGIGKLRDPSKVMAWVYQVMVNECINRCKRAKRTEYIEEMVTEPVVFQPDTFAGEEVVMKLQLLPPRPRAVFNMLEVEELTEEEAAARLKTSVGNVRTMMSRAKRMLRDMLTK